MAYRRAVLGILVVGALAVVALGVVIYGITVGIEVTAGPSTRARLVTIEDLGLERDPANETLIGRRYLDGRELLSYEYELADEGLSVSSVSISGRSEADAEIIYQDRVARAAVFTETLDREVYVSNSILLSTWGDRATANTLSIDAETVGCTVVTREGRHVYSIIVMGVPFETDTLRHDLRRAFEQAEASW